MQREVNCTSKYKKMSDKLLKSFVVLLLAIVVSCLVFIAKYHEVNQSIQYQVPYSSLLQAKYESDSHKGHVESNQKVTNRTTANNITFNIKMSLKPDTAPDSKDANNNIGNITYSSKVDTVPDSEDANNNISDITFSLKPDTSPGSEDANNNIADILFRGYMDIKSNYQRLSCKADQKEENQLTLMCENGTRSRETVIKTCDNLRRPKEEEIDYRNKYWQAQQISTTSDPERRLYFMHAYYDDRPVFNGSVYIRLFAVLSDNGSPLKPYCYLWFDWLEAPVVVAGIVKATNGRRKISVKGHSYRNCIISCPVPDVFLGTVNSKEPKLTHVSVYNAGNCGASTVFVPVTYPEKPDTWDHIFGMCESNGVSFGYFDDKMALWLIEWIEANLMFGITEMNIYNATLQVSANTKKVFDYYQEQGLLIIHQQPPPITDYDPMLRDVADIAMRTALNDCLYRNMYRYKYAPTVDIDEIFVPYMHDNYTALFDEVEKHNPIHGSHSFKSVGRAFFKSYTGEDNTATESKYPLQTMQYKHYIKDYLRPKTFFNPRHCLGAFAHYCLKKIPGTVKVGGKMPSGYLGLHHYRNNCVKDASTTTGQWSLESCQSKQLYRKYSDRMLYFEEELNARVENVKVKLSISTYDH